MESLRTDLTTALLGRTITGVLISSRLAAAAAAVPSEHHQLWLYSSGIDVIKQRHDWTALSRAQTSDTLHCSRHSNVVTGEQLQIHRLDFAAVGRNWFSQLYFHIRYQLATGRSFT